MCIKNGIFIILKWQLEDLSLRYLQPEAYHRIAKSLDERRADREDYIEQFMAIADEFAIEQNYPNPFSGVTTIKFTIRKKSNFQLRIYDVLGNEVATLVDEYKPAGSYEVEWDASGLPSGVYFYQLQARDFIETKKMILMK